MCEYKISDPFLGKISLEEAIEEYDKSFEKRWRDALCAFREEKEDCLYLIGPSSYLISIGGERIAVDPQVRRASDLERVADTVKEHFGSLSAILITHEHDDHFSNPFARLLADTDVIFYLPHDMKKCRIEASELPEERIRLVQPGDVFEIGALTVKAFHSPHVPKEASFEMPERGYELSAACGRILLPGDIREYSYDSYPKELSGADLCIAHVWAGNDTVHPAQYLPRMEQAADFFARFGAKRYFFAHLYEIGRLQHVMWDTEHADLLGEKIQKRLPSAETKTLLLGYGYRLFSGEEIF